MGDGSAAAVTVGVASWLDELVAASFAVAVRLNQASAGEAEEHL